ncbi:MAG TPA: Ig domain-containing protein [Pseudonocardiaceae bacterium]|nr:Ig domain-containing protein [Pseudonocardiaceae bacterium]
MATVAQATTAAPAGSAPSSTISAVNPYNPAYQHSYRHGAVPTVQQSAKMRAFQQANPAVAAANTLAFGGGIDGIGVTSGTPKIYLVFFGSQWGSQSTDSGGNLTFSNDSQSGAPYIQKLFKGLGTGSEGWSGTMTQYCDGSTVATGATTCPSGAPHVGYPTGGAFAGVWYDNSAAEPTAANGNQLAKEAIKAASHFGNTNASANRFAQYDILSAPGLNPDNYQTGGFCAWHDYNGDTTLTGGAASSSVGDVAFTNMPYVMDVGASCGQNFVNGNGPVDGYSIVNGHEYAETVSDQNPAGGWTNPSSGAENGDECAWITSGQGASANVTTGTGTFAMQSTWSNDTNRCDITHATIGGGGGAGSPTANNPGNQTGTVGTAVSLQLSASGGTAPYTWTATGLPTSLSISSGGLISGTPSAAGSFTVTATVHDSAGKTGSATFGWTISSGGGGGCTSPGQKLGNPGFESGATVWSSTPAVIGQNGPSEPAHSGSWNAWLDGYGTTHTDTVSQSVTIPSGCSASLSFFLHIDTAETTTTTAFDKLTVKLGSTTLGTFSNLNAAAGYTSHSFNVSGFAGQTVTLTFTGTEDASLQTSFVLDDTALTAS